MEFSAGTTDRAGNAKAACKNRLNGADKGCTNEFRCGCGPIPLRFQGGVARSAGVVGKRSRSLLIDIREAHLILLEPTNHPVCAAKEWGLFINGAAAPL